MGPEDVDIIDVDEDDDVIHIPRRKNMATLEQEFEDYKAESQNNLEQYEVQLETINSERQRLCIAAALVLDMLYPASAGSNSGSVEKIAGLLKNAPEQVKGLVMEHATVSCSQALSITSHFTSEWMLWSLARDMQLGHQKRKHSSLSMKSMTWQPP